MPTRRLLNVSTCLVLAGLSACDAAPEPDGTDPPLASKREPVIIHFARGLDLPALAAAGRGGRRALIEALRHDAARSRARALALMRRSGFEPSERLWMINAVAASLPAAVIDAIARLPEVERVEPDLLLEAPTEGIGGGEAVGWNLATIGAPELWASGHRGAGVVVAALDTGVDLEHPDLSGAWREAAGWYDPYEQHPTPHDASGHGTQVMGLVVGGDASGEPIGVAPGAQWIGAKIFDDSGVASLSGIHLALQWVLDPDGDPSTDDAADVVVGSWGYGQLVDQCYLEFEIDIATLRAAQIANVFAAGNTGPYSASSVSPANNPSSLAAGAIGEDLVVTESSARGPDACTGSIYPELVAPGATLRTTDRTLGGLFPSSYAIVSGTSFAASHVAGAIALLRAAHPGSTVAQVEDALKATAVDLSAAGADHESGFGLLDLVSAEAHLASALAAPTCTDADEDGYFAEPGCGASLDCVDDDALIHPAACDIRGDGIDQDCSGADRVKGRRCPGE